MPLLTERSCNGTCVSLLAKQKRWYRRSLVQRSTPVRNDTIANPYAGCRHEITYLLSIPALTVEWDLKQAVDRVQCYLRTYILSQFQRVEAIECFCARKLPATKLQQASRCQGLNPRFSCACHLKDEVTYEIHFGLPWENAQMDVFA